MERLLDQLKAFKEDEADLYDLKALYSYLFEYYLPEMPYGTAKARTGDPDQWIAERLEDEHEYNVIKDKVKDLVVCSCGKVVNDKEVVRFFPSEEFYCQECGEKALAKNGK